jgi:hypothetical protein
MFSKLSKSISGWFKTYYIVLGLIGFSILASILWTTYDSLKNPPDLMDFKGGIQNHLVWSIKGECYYVRPYTTNTTYLIRVLDCDKTNTGNSK